MMENALLMNMAIFCDCKRNRIHLFILQNSDFEYFKWESKKACMSREMVVSYEALLYNQKFWTLIDEEKRWFLICLVKYIVHICSLQVVNLFILVGVKDKQYIYFIYKRLEICYKKLIIRIYNAFINTNFKQSSNLQ